MNGWKQTYELRWKSGAPNFESVEKKQFKISITGDDYFVFDPQTWEMTINLLDKPEAPMP